MDRKAYHRDFVVEHTDVHTWQDNAENADRAIVTDLLGYGIAAGLTLTEQSSPNLTLQLAAGVAYDALGRRINVPANVTVNLGTDTDGNTTGVASGQERFVAVYLRFKRTAEDPSTAPDATTVYTTQRETYEVLRVAGASAPVSTATYPATPSGNPVLLGRVKITNGMTAIRTTDVRLLDVPVLNRAEDVYDESVRRDGEVSPTDPPSMALRVAAGRFNIDDTHVAYTGGTSPTFTAPTSNPRIDLLYLAANGTLGVRQGTEASSPVRPSTRGVLPLAFVGLSPSQTTITPQNLQDARGFQRATTGTRRYYETTGTSSQTALNLPFAYTPGAHCLEVIVDGAVLAESEYTETDATTVTLLSALSGGEKVSVRALDTSALETVALASVTDSLNGLLIGGNYSVKDIGSGTKIYIAPIQLVVLGQRSYSATGGFTITPSGYAAGAWRYLYLYASGGTLAVEVSPTPPDDSYTWKGGASGTHRYLGPIRTDGSGVPLPGHQYEGWWYWDRTLFTTGLNVLTAGTQTSWTSVSCASLVPPVGSTVTLALLELQVNASGAANGGVEVRKINAPGTGVPLLVEANTAAQEVHREVHLTLGGAQQFDYRIPSGYSGTATVRVLGFLEK